MSAHCAARFRHRLLLPEAEIEGLDADTVIQRILVASMYRADAPCTMITLASHFGYCWLLRRCGQSEWIVAFADCPGLRRNSVGCIAGGSSRCRRKS